MTVRLHRRRGFRPPGLAALSLLLAAAAVPTVGHASEIGASRHFGLGVVLGDPTGLTGKLYFTKKSALAFEVGTAPWGWYRSGGYAQVAYNWHPTVLANTNDVDINWHVGVGAFAGSWGYGPIRERRYYWQDRGSVGARVPVGLDFDLNKAPVQFFLEGAVRVWLAPWTAYDGSIALGGRYYF